MACEPARVAVLQLRVKGSKAIDSENNIHLGSIRELEESWGDDSALQGSHNLVQSKVLVFGKIDPEIVIDRREGRTLLNCGHHADEDAVDFLLGERLEESAKWAD